MDDFMRQQFEAAYDRGDLFCADGPYDNPRKNQALAIWRASREAVEIELPEKWGEYTEAGFAACEAIDACATAIKAAGLKAKLHGL